jgi:hypothetical protein
MLAPSSPEHNKGGRDVSASQMGGKRARRRIVQVLGVNFIFLALGLTALELHFGNWFGSNMAIVGPICNSQLAYSAETIYGSKKTIRYTRDAQCLRGHYRPTSVDIITVGGSTTDQRYLSDGETWQDWIENHYSQVGRRISIANAGVDGQTTIGHLWNFEFWFPLLASQPKYYLFYIGINDLYQTAPNGSYDEGVKGVKGYGLSGLERLKARSAFYYLYRTVEGINLAEKRKAGHTRVDFDKLSYTEEGLLDDYSFHRSYISEQFVPRLEALTSATRKMGSEAIFVTQRSYAWKEGNQKMMGVKDTFDFSGLIVNGVDRYRLERDIAQAILEYCAVAGLECIDAFNVAYGLGDFYDLHHNSPAGAAKLGQHLGKSLIQKISLSGH